MGASSLLQRLCNSDSTNEPSEPSISSQRQRAKGILSQNEKFIELIEDDEESHMFLEISVEQLSEIEDVEAFDCVSIEGKRAIQWAKKYPEVVEVYVEIIDAEDTFKIAVKNVCATELTNELIEYFAGRFGNSMEATFDPLGTDHNEPYLAVQPW